MIERFRPACAAAGFDLVQPFDSAWCARDPDLVAAIGSSDSALAVVVGNTRALWPVLIRAIRSDPARLDRSNVVDDWAEEKIGGACAAASAPFRVLWAHRLNEPVVPVQRFARVAGLAWLSPANLSIHPRFGPWIGLRAVVLFDLPGPGGAAPHLADPCGACARACLPAFESARHRVDASWADWLAARDACPLGREFRYPDEQLAYHYTKDLAYVRRSAGFTAET